MKVVEGQKLEIVWVEDPEARAYEQPCIGCDDYCEIGDDDLLKDVYDVTHCSGRRLIRQTTMWRASIVVRAHLGLTRTIACYDQVPSIATAMMLFDLEEATAADEAEEAASKLQRSSFDG